MTTETKELLTIRDYELALEAWSGGACNSFALLNALGRVKDRVRNSLEAGDEFSTDKFNQHPIIRLYLAQLGYLAGIGIGECGTAVEDVEAILERLKQ